jgi:hypothetical protein
LLLSSSKPSLGVFQLVGHLLHIPTSTWSQKFLSPLPCIKEEAFTLSSPRHQFSSKELFKKGSNGVGKEKKFYAKSGTKGACVDCGLGFCMSCLMSF